MLRQIHIRITTGSIPVPVPDGSFQLWYATDERVLPSSYNLALSTRVDLVGGEATIEVESTTSNFVWVIQTFVYDQLGYTLNYKQVPEGSGLLEFEDLVEINPDTLLPGPGPESIWVAELNSLKLLIDNRPDIMILNAADPVPPGTIPDTIILRKVV